MTPALAIVGATVRFGGVPALDDVSLAVAPGTTFGIVGESGSGKTTLMRAALGLQPLHAGAVRLLGAALRPGRRGFLERAGLIQPIFQDPAASLSPRLRVGALMAEVGTIRGEPAAATRERLGPILDRLGLPAGVLGRFPHELSGGQARRAAVARVLLMQPRIIVADEPTAGLDVSVQDDLLNLLQDLREQAGITLVVISHNLAVVRLIADAVAVMRHGRVVEAGGAARVFDAPRQPYTRDLLASWPGTARPAREDRAAVQRSAEPRGQRHDQVRPNRRRDAGGEVGRRDGDPAG